MTCHCWLEDDRMSHVKGVGTSVLQPQGIDSANNLNEPGTGISPEPPDKSLGWSTPWFWSRELLSRGPVDSTWTSNSQKLWNYKFVLFKDAKFLVICYGSNRKVIHLPQIKIKSTPEIVVDTCVAMPSSRASSWPRDWTWVSLCLLHWQADSLPLVPPGKSTY